MEAIFEPSLIMDITDMEQAPVDWQEQVRRAVELSSGLGDGTALRLLGLEGADLTAVRNAPDPSADWRENDADTPDPRPTTGEQLVRSCAAHGRTRVLRWLAEQGVNLLAVQPHGGGTAALISAKCGQFEALRCVVEHAGPEALRAVAEDGWTCAHYTASRGYLTMLQWIVAEAGIATLSATELRITPLTETAINGQLDVLKWIVSQLGPDCLRATNHNRETAVFEACYNNHLAVVEYIFDVLDGAALRVADNYGETPLLLLEGWAPRARSRRRWRT